MDTTDPAPAEAARALAAPPRRLRRVVQLALALLLLPTVVSASGRRLDLVHQSIRLPGAPATVIATDLDGDGRRDLAVFVAYTRWDQTTTLEEGSMDDVDGLVEVMTIVPFLADRRELRGFLASATGELRPVGQPLELPTSILALSAGPPGIPLLALTDDGAAAIRFEPENGGGFVIEPLVADPPVLAGSGVFVPRLELVADLTGDGIADLLLPADDGIAVYPGTGDGLAARAAARLSLEASAGRRDGSGLVRRYPWPELSDLDGDERPDLLWRDPDAGWRRPRIILNDGSLTAGDPPVIEIEIEPAAGAPDEEDTSSESIVFVGDLDGDGRAEVVTQEEIEPDPDAGMREEIAYAEAPGSIVRIYPLGEGLQPTSEPATSFEVTGYAFEGEGEGDGDSDIHLPGGFQDLNADGRLDLVTVTLQISVLKMMGALAIGRVTLPLDFHVWCQRDDGSFRAVSSLDLSGKFRLRLDDLSLRDLPMFGGDFDGDGRVDFVQVGRGRTMTIHRGRSDCSFPAEPDLEVRLRQEPADLGLLQIRDLDGDGRSDVLLVQPLEVTDTDTSPPVALDLYLSGGAAE